MKESWLFDFNERARRDRQAAWVRILAVVLIIAWSFLSARASLAGEAKPGWEAEWEKTLAAARQEGQVSIYGTSPIHAIAETGVFQKAYPGIKVVTVAPAPAEAFQRLMAERRAGRYIADLYTAGATSPLMLLGAKALEPIKPLLVLPEVADESKWWGRKHHYNDHEQKYIFVYTGNPQIGSFSFNTNLVNIKEITSFWDLLHPKWKGKIESRDIRIPGPGSVNTLFYFHNPLLGPKFIRRLYAEMELTLFRDRRQGVDWLASGKFAICFFCGNDETDIAKRQGLPVANLESILEGAAITSHGGAVVLVNKAPHPNGAKVFVNWLLSREGQLTSQSTGRGHVNSRRIDIPKDMIPPHGRLIEGVNYMDVETPERNDLGPAMKVIEEALAEAEKRKKG
jgi:iron(III) transport system substrate-binding protein